MTHQYLATIPSPVQGVWHFGPIPIRAYAVCILLGIVAAVAVAEVRMRRRGAPNWFVLDVAVYAIPAGIIGARIYHVITSPEAYFGANGHVMGVFYVLISTALNTSVQARVDEDHRGRVMAIHLMCLLAGVPFGALILGKLASLVGLGESIIGFGIALEACVGFAVVFLDRLRAIDEVRSDLVHTDPLLVPAEIVGAD